MGFKKILTMAVFIAMCAAVPSFATNTGDKGMGLYEYPWFIDGLQSYIYENPAYLSQYKNSAFAERVGVTDGQNMGGLFFSPISNLTVGLHFGQPVDDTVWNTKAINSLYHIDNYSVKSIALPVYVHSSSGQAFGGYQMEMLDGSIIDISDPVDGSAPVGTAEVSPELRGTLDQRNFSAMAAYTFGRAGVGLSFGYATSWKNKRTGDGTTVENDEYNMTNTEYSTNLGGYFKINEKVSIDGDGSFVVYQMKNTYKKIEPGITSKMSYGASGAMDFGGDLRLNYQMTPIHLMHFNLGYEMQNRSTYGSMKITNLNVANRNVRAKDTFTRKGQFIEFGISDEFKMGNDVKAFVGFNTEVHLQSNSYSGKDSITAANNLNKYSNKTTTISLPLLVGMEAKLSENWTGRFGLVQVIYQPLTDSGKNVTNSATGGITVPTTTNDNSTSSTIFNTGVSYKLGSLTFDWLASIDLFTNGPYIISGKAFTSAEPTPMAMAFAVTYNFDTASTDSTPAAAEPVKPAANKPAGR